MTLLSRTLFAGFELIRPADSSCKYCREYGLSPKSKLSSCSRSPRGHADRRVFLLAIHISRTLKTDLQFPASPDSNSDFRLQFLDRAYFPTRPELEVDLKTVCASSDKLILHD